MATTFITGADKGLGRPPPDRVWPRRRTRGRIDILINNAGVHGPVSRHGEIA